MAEYLKLKELEIGIYYTAEMDEFCSFVENKHNQRWTWYAMDKRSGITLAWHNGGRTDADFLKLYSYLAQLPIKHYFTDNWGGVFKISSSQTALYRERSYMENRKEEFEL